MWLFVDILSPKYKCSNIPCSELITFKEKLNPAIFGAGLFD